MVYWCRDKKNQSSKKEYGSAVFDWYLFSSPRHDYALGRHDDAHPPHPVARRWSAGSEPAGQVGATFIFATICRCGVEAMAASSRAYCAAIVGSGGGGATHHPAPSLPLLPHNPPPPSNIPFPLQQQPPTACCGTHVDYPKVHLPKHPTPPLCLHHTAIVVKKFIQSSSSQSPLFLESYSNMHV